MERDSKNDSKLIKPRTNEIIKAEEVKGVVMQADGKRVSFNPGVAN